MKIGKIIIPFFAGIDDIGRKIKEIWPKAKVLDLDVVNREVIIDRNGTSQRYCLKKI